MIVDPDFMDHWRTGMVVDALGDPMAPVYILRLWAHCQERKSDTFAIPTRGLKAQCKFPGDAQAFEDALTEAGFIEREGDSILVCGWAEKNSSLLAAWANGNKGGRPKKAKTEPSGNPRVTETEPMANPSETHAEPIRVEKIREEKKEEGESARKRAPAPVRPDDVTEQTWQDWSALRTKKKAPITQTVLNEAQRECAKASMPLERFLQIWCMRGSIGMQADWIKPHERGSPRSGETDYQRSQRERMAELAPGVARRAPDQSRPLNVIDLEFPDVLAIARH